ncbi:MAG: hypothetical protein ACJ765_01140 [Chloroflexota bacterium]
MGGLHAAAAVVSAGTVALLLAASLAATVGWSRGRLWLDRAIAVQVVATLAAVASGLLVLADGSRPAEALHFLYAIVLAGLPLGLRAIAGRWPTRRVGTWLVLGSLVAGGVVIRAFMTGS